jgi:hypothetical protein
MIDIVMPCAESMISGNSMHFTEPRYFTPLRPLVRPELSARLIIAVNSLVQNTVSFARPSIERSRRTASYGGR